MTEYLRSNEILACEHRIALSRGAEVAIDAAPTTPEIAQRQRVAIEHRRLTLDALRQLHPEAIFSTNPSQTSSLMSSGCELILSARLESDPVGRREGFAHLLVRVGRTSDAYVYAPVLIKNHEVVENSTTRRTLQAPLERPRPSDATFRDGLGVRSSLSVIRSGLALSHVTRMLETLGHRDPSARGGIIDRRGQLWWLELNTTSHPRFNLNAYDRLYERRYHVVEAHERWREGRAPYPTAPYWHRDCPECVYRLTCHEQLEEVDDISLVRFTTLEQQRLLRDHGLQTRTQLAKLDPDRVRHVRSTSLNALTPLDGEAFLGQAIDHLDELIYRARSQLRGSPLRKRSSEQTGCPSADVEVDVDMESYGDATYLWGAYVSTNHETPRVTTGYHPFVDWRPLTPEIESENFAKFWQWLTMIQRTCDEQGRTFASYCFWAHAEDSAMDRAVKTPRAGGPTLSDLSSFRHDPRRWIDVHELVKGQIQTEGPRGLKHLATNAGFRWRDPNPSGEASMLWYEEARQSSSPANLDARRRILEYNEDDCRATKALRNWLNGPARELAHRDDSPTQ